MSCELMVAAPPICFATYSEKNMFLTPFWIASMHVKLVSVDINVIYDSVVIGVVLS